MVNQIALEVQKIFCGEFERKTPYYVRHIFAFVPWRGGIRLRGEALVYRTARPQ
jgi:hypothetical protein